MIAAKNTTRIRSLLRSWYRRSAITYPWRESSATPYTILVAEFMLQQTQAQRVADLLPVFLSTYPSIGVLADASNAEVIKAWKGLGYNNRAIRLRDTARLIVEQHRGVLPDDPAVLRSMPGIGPYASQSLPCFAYGHRTVVVDVNVRRVYSRLYNVQPDTHALESMQTVHRFAELIIPQTGADEWHHAVMDLGATICKARIANCPQCPLRSQCPSAGIPQAPYQKRASTEPQIRGIARRIWRGRLVERLRQAGVRGLSLTELLPEGYRHKDEHGEWMEMLSHLQRDGIVDVGRRVKLRD